MVLTPGGSGSFDAHHPPRRELLDDCVHCGFCLPSCPTYAVGGEEMDSPRGRIYLIDLAQRGEIPLDRTIAGHIDSCLGCLACVPACPSGVQYDLLLEATRPQLERHVPRTRRERLVRRAIFAVFPYPARMRVAALFGVLYRRLGLRALAHRLGVVDRLPAELRAAEDLLPPVPVRSLFRRLAPVTPAAGERRLRVALLEGCAQRVLFGDVNAATARVLAAEGCEVVVPQGQQCCGALNLHAGLEDDAAARARKLIDTFEQANADVVVVNVAGCGSSMKEYDRLLADDPAYAGRAARFAASVRDVNELLADLEPRAVRHPVQAKIAYHDACHLANAQRIRRQPRDLLRAVPGVEVTDVAEAEICCGSAGIYNLVQPDMAEELGRRKAANLESAAPDVIATANAGCLLQVRRFLSRDIPLVHPIEILDASIRGVPLDKARR